VTRVVVIGGGHNSLVAGAYLGKAGLSPLILERRDQLGGALELAHDVGRLSPAVVAELDLAMHGLSLIRPEVRAWAPSIWGPAITLYANPALTGLELQSVSMSDGSSYSHFDRLVQSLTTVVARLNDMVPPDLGRPTPADGLSAWRLARSFRGLDPKDAQTLMRVLPMAVADFTAEHFENEGVRALIAARGVRYGAVGPWSAGTTGMLLGDSAGTDGGAAGALAFAAGGPKALITALVSAARSSGAEIRTGAGVAAITSAGSRVTGVVLDSGEEIEARAVVSGADPKHTLTALVDPVALGPTARWRAGNIRTRGVVAKVDLVLDAVPEFRGLEDESRLVGRIVIAPSIDYLERAHDATKYGRVAESPFIEAAIPSLSDPLQGGSGRHLMSCTVQYAPYHLKDGEWHAAREDFADLVIKTMEEYAPGIGDRVVDRRIHSPLDLEREFGLSEGHPMHAEHGLDQFFAWRPMLGFARYRLGLEGLYLCGAGAHPGGGITGMPGRNAARVIVKDLRKRRPR
jgi:phytoene dehydrogenase-like protein